MLRPVLLPGRSSRGDFFLIIVKFLCVCAGFFAGFSGRGVRGGGSMANLLCE